MRFCYCFKKAQFLFEIVIIFENINITFVDIVNIVNIVNIANHKNIADWIFYMLFIGKY